MNPCSYTPIGSNSISAMPYDSNEINKLIALNPTNWLTNYNTQNYIGTLQNNNCSKDRPYLVNGKCVQCQGQTSYYDANTKVCVGCATGTYFS